jgi:hypothetical protein
MMMKLELDRTSWIALLDAAEAHLTNRHRNSWARGTPEADRLRNQLNSITLLRSASGVIITAAFSEPTPPNLTCHGCRKQVPHDHVGPCPQCGAGRECIWL